MDGFFALAVAAGSDSTVDVKMVNGGVAIEDIIIHSNSMNIFITLLHFALSTTHFQLHIGTFEIMPKEM